MPPKDLKPTQLYMETENGERIEVLDIPEIALETNEMQEGGCSESIIGGEAEIEIELTEEGKKQVNEFFEPLRKDQENIINLPKRTYLCNNWRKMHGLPLIRRRRRR